MERGFSVSQSNWLCQNVPERPLGTESAQRHSRGDFRQQDAHALPFRSLERGIHRRAQAGSVPGAI